MSRPAASRLEQGARTREKVLEVASALMAQRGYSGTSISSISKASGVMPASIYWHFENKEGLLAAVVERAAELWFRDLKEAVQQVDPSAGGGMAPFEALRVTLRAEPGFFRLLLLLALERREVDSQSLAALRKVREQVVSFLHAALDPLIPVADRAKRSAISARLAELMLVLIDGTFIARQIAPDSEDLQPLYALAFTSLREAARGLIEAAEPGATGSSATGRAASDTAQGGSGASGTEGRSP